MKRLIASALFSCALLAAILILASPALAHKVGVFAYVEDGRIKGEGYFAGGDKAVNCAVEVLDASGRTLASAQTDAQGGFSLPLPAAAPPLTIVVQAGQGHRGDYTLTAADLGASGAGEDQAATTVQEPAAKAEAAAPVAGVGPAELERVINQALDRKLAPLTAQVAKLAGERGVGLAEVIGGIGYILGLLGLAAYIKARKG